MDPSEITLLLRAASGGDRAALDAVFSATYEELRSLAHQHRLRWTGNETMATTVLVHEAWRKLARQERVHTRDRAHFMAVAARAMRQVLVNYAEERAAEKRGGGARHLSLDEVNPVAPEAAEEVLALHHALERLSVEEPRASRVVECRFFAGLSIDETGDALGVSSATVKRDWALATLWLRKAMGAEADPPPFGADSPPFGEGGVHG
jgi:RNA polymerase sigma factor (TIGR02999 family)